MKTKNGMLVAFFSVVMLIAAQSVCFGVAGSRQSQETAGQKAIARSLGVVKAINGNAITLTPSSGPEVAVSIQPNARLLRLAPGDKDLKNATPLQLLELQVGDTVRVRGYASDDAKSINALELILITRSSVQAVSEQMRQDWQKRGVGGMVDSVDAATGNVNISIPGLAGKRTIVVRTSRNTVVHRYAPDSDKPEDAKPSSLQQIQPGDQLRARGKKSADGSEITAEEIYAGLFPRYVGTVKSVDASAGTMSVQDLSSKKTVQLRVTGESQLHKIPAEMAQRFAMRLKATMPAGTPGAASGSSAPGSSAPSGSAASTPQSGAASSAPTGASGVTGAGPRSGAPDFQQMVSRLPTSTLPELNLQKGDAVVLLATEGTPSSAPTVITLLSGVEPILQAAPNGGQAMMLAPWSLGGGPPGGDNGNQ